MKFNLPLHLVEIEREEKACACSLAAYASLIRLNVDLYTHMPELTQGAGKTGPPFQTIRHNAAFLEKRFPEMRKEFVEGVSEELNFKLRELGEEEQAQLAARKEERQQKFRKLSLQQKHSVDSILGLLSKVASNTRITNLFEVLEVKKPKRLPLPVISLQLQTFEEGCELEVSWQKADEMVSKMKQQQVKHIHLGEKITA